MFCSDNTRTPSVTLWRSAFGGKCHKNQPIMRLNDAECSVWMEPSPSGGMFNELIGRGHVHISVFTVCVRCVRVRRVCACVCVGEGDMSSLSVSIQCVNHNYKYLFIWISPFASLFDYLFIWFFFWEWWVFRCFWGGKWNRSVLRRLQHTMWQLTQGVFLSFTIFQMENPAKDQKSWQIWKLRTSVPKISTSIISFCLSELPKLSREKCDRRLTVWWDRRG